jgi:drug/metabolite transporter (DMT)-like permease
VADDNEVSNETIKRLSGLPASIAVHVADRFGVARARFASGNARGIVMMLAAMAAFVAGDAAMKVMSTRLPIGETMFVRGVMATALVWGLAVATGATRHLPRCVNGLLAWRTASDVGGAIFFQNGLSRLPFADAGAILQLNPLVVTAGAALFLGERVGWRRWSATGVGLIGALLIIRPGGSTFQWASLLMIGATLCAASRDLCTRMLPIGIPGLLMTAFSVTAVTMVSLVFRLFETWVRPSLLDVALLAIPAACMLIGQLCVVASIRAGEVSAVVPFRYSAILWTLLASFLIWGEFPDLWTLTGIAIIATAGLYTFHREQTLQRAARRQAATAAATPLADAKAGPS